ncbi:MAG: hypothetical protein EHM55_01845 [Acidobacteria bacterium]|nr:MAG: hypothetical protein EHM55_01845 [Acidobacteriota bacterium]
MIERLEETASPEGREKQWVSPSDALQQLAFEDARELLRLALREIDARVAMTARQDGFDEFLLHEYDHLGQSLLANEENGEKRVTFFLTLCGAVGAAVGFLVGDGALEPSDRLLVVISLLVLFMLGYVTFLRVVVRNASSDRYKNQLARLRQRFLHGEADARIAFLPFHPYELTRRKRRTSFWRLGKGGWAETMALVESLIGGGVIAFVAWTIGGSSLGMLLVSGVLGVFAGCFRSADPCDRAQRVRTWTNTPALAKPHRRTEEGSRLKPGRRI